jgi:N6-L-threonylcarbamoyladenine synthase
MMDRVRAFTVLGIETSCDETAAAVVRGSAPGPGEILSNIVLSQIEAHQPYGGVVPEIAARAHVEALDAIVEEALAKAGIGLTDLDAVAATAGPGLIGGVMVGLTTAKALSLAADKPLIAINHLEAHALTARLTNGAEFPFLLLLISGGHCQLLAVEGVGRFHLYGTTIDDAVGEAFDKTAKLLGLPYPGGPNVEGLARRGNPHRFALPRPMLGRDGADFSLSGLKTAVRQIVRSENWDDDARADLAASFQAAVLDILIDRSAAAMARFRAEFPGADTFVVAGGVAANTAIRNALTGLCAREGFETKIPPPRLCTDNAAMVAWAGVEHGQLGLFDALTVAPRARWPLQDAPVGGSQFSGASERGVG